MTRFLFLLAITLFAAAPTYAQMVVPGASTAASEPPANDTLELPIPLTEDAIALFMSTLSDTQVRTLLFNELSTRVNPQPTEPSANTQTRSLFHHATLGAALAALKPAQGIGDMLKGLAQSFANFTAQHGEDGWYLLISILVIAAAVGYLAERIFNMIATRALRKPEALQSSSLKVSLVFLTRRLIRETLGGVVFVVVSATCVDLLMPDGLELYGFAALLTLLLAPRIVFTIVRFLLTPKHPEHRFVFASDETARFLTKHSIGMALLIGAMQFVSQFNALSEAPDAAPSITYWLDLALRTYFIWVVWRSWHGLVGMMKGTDGEVGPWEDRMSRAFPFFAILVVFGMWWLINIIASYDALYLLAERPDITTVGLLVAAPAIDTLIRAVVKLSMPAMTGEGPIAEEAYAATAGAYKRIGRILVFGLMLFQLADIWDVSRDTFASSGVIGLVLQSFFHVSFTLALGYLAWEVISLVINRKLAAELTLSGWNPQEDELGDSGGIGGTRLTTILPLVLKCLRVAIIILFGLLTLSELGVNITPLLAGASILGLAIGFGSQKLVTDVVSGVFFLLDDAFRVGEYLDIGGTMGTVERISIRSLRLRHHRGLLHTIPYSEVPKLTNYSRDWVIMKLKFTVPFGTDPEKVRKIFKKIGLDLLEHPELGKDFIQPFKSQGVFAFDDVGMVIRGKFMAKPGGQFMIRKEVYNRVNAAFAENGIEFARREVRVAIPSLEKSEGMDDADNASIAAAAGEAVRQQADAETKSS